MTELRVVPDSLAFPAYQRTFGSAAPWGSASQNRYPIRSTPPGPFIRSSSSYSFHSPPLDVISRCVGMGVVTKDEARAMMKLSGV